MEKKSKYGSIDKYVFWCNLMELDPKDAKNVDRYQKLCKKMSAPKFEIQAKFENGKRRTYILPKLDLDNLPKILMIGEEENIYLKIYKINDNGDRSLIFDGLFLQLASGVEDGRTA